MSDCPDCWETPCVCERGYLGSKIYAYAALKKEMESCREASQIKEDQAFKFKAERDSLRECLREVTRALERFSPFKVSASPLDFAMRMDALERAKKELEN